MSKERLSRLQKWIMVKIYDDNINYKRKHRGRVEGDIGLRRRDIYKKYFEVDTTGAHKLMTERKERWQSWSLYPRVFQTLGNMEKKDLIIIFRKEDRYNSMIFLTEKGNRIAKELYNLGSGNLIINNKNTKPIKLMKPIHEKVSQDLKRSYGITTESMYKTRKIQECHKLGLVSDEEIEKLKSRKVKLHSVYREAKKKLHKYIISECFEGNLIINNKKNTEGKKK